MSENTKHVLLILIVAVTTILVRPCIVFASQTLSSPINAQNNSIDIKQVVRKRNEHNYSHEECLVLDEIRQKAFGLSAFVFLYFLRKQRITLLLILSHISSCLSCLFKQRVTIFQISPHNDHYLSLSVFRI